MHNETRRRKEKKSFLFYFSIFEKKFFFLFISTQSSYFYISALFGVLITIFLFLESFSFSLFVIIFFFLSFSFRLIFIAFLCAIDIERDVFLLEKMMICMIQQFELTFTCVILCEILELSRNLTVKMYFYH